MNLSLQRRLASEVLKCGKNRIWFNPEMLEEISTASTKQDIRELIEKGAIKKKSVKGVCRSRINKKRLKKVRGRGRGHGRRRGKKTARLTRKRIWIMRIRALRRRLKELKKSGEIDTRSYRILYRKAKGGEFRSVAHLNSFVQEMKR
ncbi:MAG: 50S ribosomal protein L19e [Archaeoglobaceae archaeon]|nr:50S ribosomal protein L19e [Archaeoglobaceae archaeon]MDW7989620.1 50S ribosomal protein L19e [Archaeoglobaceae archaeon]